MIRAIVFDFDGVLVDSEPMHEAALRAAVRKLGLDFTHDDYMARYVGFDDRDAFAAIATDHERRLTDQERTSLMQWKAEAIDAALARGEPRLWPGSAELVTSVSRLAPTAICSGALRTEIEPILRAAGLSDRFQTIVTADDVAKAKPDPTGYLLAAELLNLPPAQCIAIEDTPTGIDAAKAAGYTVIAVEHTFPAEQLGSADVIVESTALLSAEQLLAM